MSSQVTRWTKFSLSEFLDSYYLPTFVKRDDIGSSSINTTKPAHPHTDLQNILKWDTFQNQMQVTERYLGSTETTLDDMEQTGLLPATVVQAFYKIIENRISPNPEVYLRMAVGFPMTPRKQFVCSSTKQLGQWRFRRYPVDILLKFLNGQLIEPEKKKFVTAIEQMYGYMTFNYLRYGVLSNFDHTLILEKDVANPKTIRIAGPFKPGQQVVRALLTVIRLANLDYFHVSPTLPSPPANHEMFFTVEWDGEENKVDSVTFESIVARSRIGTVIRGKITGKDNVIFKSTDMLGRNRNLVAELEQEAKVLRVLSNSILNSRVPNYYGMGSIWNMLRVLVMDDVGEPLSAVLKALPPRQTRARSKLRDECVKVVRDLHNFGYLHGDVKADNFCVKRGRNNDQCVYLIDFGMAVEISLMGNKREMEEEVKLCEAIFEL
ncbi:hypothetical protein HDU76_012349 [Blyttiomyces sp. JEL0837]|nr:hypothetical protein HDU76_012349 [Blyttiomyces sp. JEL0837]